MQQTLLLSVGSDAAIVGARDLILRTAGYTVVSAISVKEAAYLVQYGDFDLLILCHTLTRKDRERLTSLIRASGSRIPIVCVSGTEPAEQNSFADATLGDDPVLFLEGLEDALNRCAPVHPVAQHCKIPAASVDKAAGLGEDTKPQETERRRMA